MIFESSKLAFSFSIRRKTNRKGYCVVIGNKISREDGSAVFKELVIENELLEIFLQLFFVFLI
jgi:hypothetical protein